MPAKPPKGKRFEKGKSGNPKGRPPGNPLHKKIAKLTADELEEIMSIIVKGDIKRLREIARSSKSTVIQGMVAKTALNIYKNGNVGGLETLLNRLVGKVADKFQHSGIPANTSSVVVTLPSNGREVKEEKK